MTPERELAAKLIAQHEGCRRFPYRDTKGILTIGVGRNLEDCGISRDEALYLLGNDIGSIAQALSEHLSWWNGLDAVRRAALLDMGMMGAGRLLGFHEMLAALGRKDWPTASAQALNSQWALDVGDGRSHDIAAILRTGVAPSWAT